ncbi:unnamed protein product, partial [Symbiodinium sp. CCMP2456]
ELPERGLQANVITYSTAITACEDQWALALDLLRDLCEGQLEPNVITYNAALSACGSCEEWHQ